MSGKPEFNWKYTLNYPINISILASQMLPKNLHNKPHRSPIKWGILCTRRHTTDTRGGYADNLFNGGWMNSNWNIIRRKEYRVITINFISHGHQLIHLQNYVHKATTTRRPPPQYITVTVTNCFLWTLRNDFDPVYLPCPGINQLMHSAGHCLTHNYGQYWSAVYGYKSRQCCGNLLM